MSIVLAFVSLLAYIIAYFWMPKKAIFVSSLLTYIVLATSIALVIISTNGYNSPLIFLWTLVSLFAFVYGVFGLLLVLISTGIYTAILYIDHLFTEPAIITIIISSILPLIIGAIIWHTKSSRDEQDDSKAFKNLANELSEVANKSEVVINAIGDGVIALDNKGIIKLINPAAQRILGWGKQDALTLNYKSVMHLIDRKNEILDASADPVQQVLNNNQQIRNNNLALVTKNEKHIQISLVVSPVGELGAGVILVFRDITNEKAEEREQFEFISTASHEMRTPVAAIEGYLGLALNPSTAQIDTRARSYIEKAQQSADHLGHLFQDLLDVSKADDGRMSNNPTVIDMVSLTGTVIQELIPKAVKKNIRLIFKPIAGSNREKHITPVYYVNLDKNHILEIINNIIENAIKYTPVGDVVVDIIGDNDHVKISVKDSGIGIPAEDMPHLFQKFYRVDNKDTREIGGTGLGLYICRRLTEIMGGRIWAESARGKGSTFFLELPRISNIDANQLLKVESEKTKKEVLNKTTQVVSQMVNTTAQQNQQPPAKATQKTISAVPRTSALTPDQIAGYVAKQRALVAQQKAAIEQQQAIQQQKAIQMSQQVRIQAQLQPQPQPQLQSQPSQFTTQPPEATEPVRQFHMQTQEPSTPTPVTQMSSQQATVVKNTNVSRNQTPLAPSQPSRAVNTGRPTAIAVPGRDVVPRQSES